MPVDLFPEHTPDKSKTESRDPRENSCRNDDREEIPEAAHERPARELIGQEAPCKWCRSDEPRKEADVGGEILYSSATKLVILGENCVLWDVFLMLNLSPFRHLACSL